MTVITVLVDMPTHVKGQTVANNDGTYSVFINARLSAEQQRKTYLHEIEHIAQRDFEKDYVQRIEAYAHGVSVG